MFNVIYQELTSATGTGNTDTDAPKLSAGWYLILTASVHPTVNYACMSKILWKRVLGDGTIVGHRLVSGYASSSNTLNLQRMILVQGPGYLSSRVNHLESMTHEFYFGYAKLSAAQVRGLFLK